MIHDNISRVVRWYKGRCSFDIRKIDANFAWQPRFYDRIIRNDAEYQRISDYIRSNPSNWAEDKFH
jgi:REP element-mobilizing transposase RayT